MAYELSNIMKTVLSQRHELPSLSSARRGLACGASWFVWGVWGAMLLAALAFVWKFGSNVPYWDEWEMVPLLAGEQAVSPGWLWSEHNGHRIPLPKLLLLAAYKFTGSDFRVGMYANVLALGAVAFAMIWVAKGLRGRSSYADAFFPLLLLHWGHCENFLWTWQLTQVTPVILVCILLIIIVQRGVHLSFGVAALAGLCLVMLPLCGFPGLVYVPALAIWFGFAGVLHWRSPDTLWEAKRARALGLDVDGSSPGGPLFCRLSRTRSPSLRSAFGSFLDPSYPLVVEYGRAVPRRGIWSGCGTILALFRARHPRLAATHCGDALQSSHQPPPCGRPLPSIRAAALYGGDSMLSLERRSGTTWIRLHSPLLFASGPGPLLGLLRVDSLWPADRLPPCADKHAGSRRPSISSQLETGLKYARHLSQKYAVIQGRSFSPSADLVCSSHDMRTPFARALSGESPRTGLWRRTQGSGALRQASRPRIASHSMVGSVICCRLSIVPASGDFRHLQPEGPSSREIPLPVGPSASDRTAQGGLGIQGIKDDQNLILDLDEPIFVYGIRITYRGGLHPDRSGKPPCLQVFWKSEDQDEFTKSQRYILYLGQGMGAGWLRDEGIGDSLDPQCDRPNPDQSGEQPYIYK